VKRGDLVTIADKTSYGGGKPRPAVIVQSDVFDATFTVLICPVTSEQIEIPNMRFSIEPSNENGLRATSWLMLDKVTPVQRVKIGGRIGRLSPADLARMDTGLAVVLGFGGG
jgi:mRNA interferase MazF